MLGRPFEPGSDAAGKNHVAVLNYGFWQRHFGGSPSVIGQTISVDNESYTVIGVMPRALRLSRRHRSVDAARHVAKIALAARIAFV